MYVTPKTKGHDRTQAVMELNVESLLPAALEPLGSATCHCRQELWLLSHSI